MNATPIATALSNDTLEMLLSPLMTRAVPSIYLLVFICSTPFNLVSLVALASIPCRHHSPTSLFAVNLVLADLMYSASLPLQIFYNFQGNDWPWGSFLCGASTLLLHCNMHVSVLITCAIALERYCGVVWPLRTQHWRTSPRAAATCLLIWVLVLVTQTPLLQHDLTLRVAQLNITTCFDVVPRSLFPSIPLAYLYFIAIMVLFYFIPLIILIGCYVAVVRTLHKSRALDKGERETASLQRAQAVVAVTGACFVTCYLPSIILQTVHVVLSSQSRSLYAGYKLALAFNSFHCCFDPVLYYCSSWQFRQKLRSLLRRSLQEGEESAMKK
ncbi:proteinase-activated receptor 1-like [Osmerus mordax]|uniref:proteinase-activated receptor 1-like n=1 Tax=Osmerus mordax TaxID=8014 RepID=UPI00350F330F